MPIRSGSMGRDDDEICVGDCVHGLFWKLLDEIRRWEHQENEAGTDAQLSDPFTDTVELHEGQSIIQN
jgi:hypothetical protein